MLLIILGGVLLTVGLCLTTNALIQVGGIFLTEYDRAELDRLALQPVPPIDDGLDERLNEAVRKFQTRGVVDRL